MLQMYQTRRSRGHTVFVSSHHNDDFLEVVQDLLEDHSEEPASPDPEDAPSLAEDVESPIEQPEEEPERVPDGEPAEEGAAASPDADQGSEVPGAEEQGGSISAARPARRKKAKVRYVKVDYLLPAGHFLKVSHSR